MKQFSRLLIAAVFSLAAAVNVWAAEYSIDPAHSSVIFKVKHLGISTVTGRFTKFTGTFEYDPENVKVSKAGAVISVASINTDIEKRDDHLKSPDFFDADKFPDMKFSGKGVKDIKKTTFKILGDLTIHGVTKPVVLEAEFGGLVKDPWGGERAAFTANTKINRKHFGLTWNKALEAGGLMVGEEVRIILEIEGIKKKEAK